ncbi:MAG: ribosome small subunit-dependent GTPase A [Bacteroidetes bacterium]|nr:ribosome small subunit-dependent GTPase A [Bacteroidota bacterium]
MNSGEALVFKSTGSWYQLRDGEGRYWQARIRGRLKMDTDIASTNPVAVGDWVRFEVEDDAAGRALIQDIVPRRNYIVRVSPHNRNQKHIVAANLDAALIIATLAEPRSSNGFIDRFLVTAEAYHIPAIIAVNKLDLYDTEQMEQLAEWQEAYGLAGYELFPVCAKAPESIRALSSRIAGCTTLFSGHSGVGKSTLINTLMPSLALRTAEVSAWSGKGQHTTTFAEMFELPDGNSRIIDTPGVKEFGLIDFEREELSHYYPEMRTLLSGCRFNNCLHLGEPGCAIKEALEEKQISLMRYESYRAILASIEKKW